MYIMVSWYLYEYSNLTIFDTRYICTNITHYGTQYGYSYCRVNIQYSYHSYCNTSTLRTTTTMTMNSKTLTIVVLLSLAAVCSAKELQQIPSFLKDHVCPDGEQRCLDGQPCCRFDSSGKFQESVVIFVTLFLFWVA